MLRNLQGHRERAVKQLVGFSTAPFAPFHYWAPPKPHSYRHSYYADEKEKLLGYLRSKDDYGDVRVGHNMKRRSGGYIHFWYDPVDDYFTAKTYGQSTTDSGFQMIAAWSFRFGSFIRGEQDFCAEYLEFDFEKGSSYTYVRFSSSLITLRSDHTFRINEPVITSVDNPSWDSEFTKGFVGEIKDAATEMMAFLDSEWSAAGMSFKLW